MVPCMSLPHRQAVHGQLLALVAVQSIQQTQCCMACIGHMVLPEWLVSFVSELLLLLLPVPRSALYAACIGQPHPRHLICRPPVVYGDMSLHRCQCSMGLHTLDLLVLMFICSTSPGLSSSQC